MVVVSVAMYVLPTRTQTGVCFSHLYPLPPILLSCPSPSVLFQAFLVVNSSPDSCLATISKSLPSLFLSLSSAPTGCSFPREASESIHAARDTLSPEAGAAVIGQPKETRKLET